MAGKSFLATSVPDLNIKRKSKFDKRMKKLGEPGKDKEEALKKKYEPEIQKATKRMTDAGMTALKNPEVAKVLAKPIQDFGKAMGGK